MHTYKTISQKLAECMTSWMDGWLADRHARWGSKTMQLFINIDIVYVSLQGLYLEWGSDNPRWAREITWLSKNNNPTPMWFFIFPLLPYKNWKISFLEFAFVLYIEVDALHTIITIITAIQTCIFRFSHPPQRQIKFIAVVSCVISAVVQHWLNYLNPLQF